MSKERLKIVHFPDELALYAPSKAEARILYHEIFETDAYGKHGIRVEDGDCVFDVGANAGFFSVHLGRKHRNLTLFAFEPLPPTFQLLQKNADMHLGAHRLTLLPYGLGARAAELVFRYDASMTFNASSDVSSMEGSMVRETNALAWARALVEDGERIGHLSAGFARSLLGLLNKPVVSQLTLFVLGLVAAPSELVKRLRRRQVTCQVRTLSAVIHEHRVERIHLLKIDVEGAEWDVLCGIDDSDWPRIEQLVIEVHDVDSRVKRIEALLQDKGFHVVIDREDWSTHTLLGIYTVYARR